jgi:hypothetical protein
MTIDVQQLLWGITSFLVVLLGFFVKRWMDKMEAKLELKLDAIMCEERHPKLELACEKLFRHKHATTGEVIVP